MPFKFKQLPHLNSDLVMTKELISNPMRLKGAGGSEDIKISKSALLSLNDHNFSNTVSPREHMRTYSLQ